MTTGHPSDDDPVGESHRPADRSGARQATGPSDERLVRQMNSGRVDAFDRIYERYRDWVYRVALRFTGQHDDALDVLQETFSYLLSKFPGFELRAHLTTFLFPAVKNLSIAANRKRRRAHGSGPEMVNAPLRDAEQPAAELVDEGLDALSRALAKLSAAHREILLLRYHDELSTRATAELLGIPVGTVKTRLHHALKQLAANPELRDYFA